MTPQEYPDSRGLDELPMEELVERLLEEISSEPFQSGATGRELKPSARNLYMNKKLREKTGLVAGNTVTVEGEEGVFNVREGRKGAGETRARTLTIAEKHDKARVAKFLADLIIEAAR